MILALNRLRKDEAMRFGILKFTLDGLRSALGLPDDVKIVSVRLTEIEIDFMLGGTNPALPEVPEGDVIPVIQRCDFYKYVNIPGGVLTITEGAMSIAGLSYDEVRMTRNPKPETDPEPKTWRDREPLL